MNQALSIWERYTAKLWSGPTAIAVSRIRDGRFLAANPDFLELVGYRRDELVGHTTFDLNLWPNVARRNAIASRLLKQTTVAGMPVEIRRKTGQPLQVMGSFRLLQHEDEACVLGIATDISDRVGYESDLEKEIAELANKNFLHARFALGMRERLDEPLRVNDGYLTRVLERCGSDETCRHFLKLAMDNNARMREFLGPAATPPPLAAPALPPEMEESEPDERPIDALELLREVIGEVTQRFREHRISLDTDAEIRISGNPLLLKRLFRYVMEGVLSPGNDVGYQVSLEVSRSGAEWLFACSHDAATAPLRSIPFSSMLDVAGQLVERLGGKLWLISGRGQRPGIWFTLPACTEQDA